MGTRPSRFMTPELSFEVVAAAASSWVLSSGNGTVKSDGLWVIDPRLGYLEHQCCIGNRVHNSTDHQQSMDWNGTRARRILVVHVFTYIEDAGLP
ncbi:hypothetical protein BDN67DRAFT_963781 [Paxillus ammoniavirescens]|nr:hypothetical protein BDN67DRAFT_963781 [Paxillus ammoniavirescens]